MVLVGCLCGLTLTVFAADDEFAKKAAMDGKTEVELGRLASTKGQSAAVRSFGRRMVKDHTNAGNKLKAIADRKGIILPAELDADHKAMVDRMAQLSGAEFDRAYMEMMVMDHEKAVSEFELESSSGTDAQLKSFARATLPTLRLHLRLAKQTAAKVN
jgi:putative membrane protein